MSAITRETAFDRMGMIRDEFILEADISHLLTVSGKTEKRSTPSGFARFMQSGWGAFAACAVVAVGIYVALLGLGKGWFGTPGGHHGTDTGTDTTDTVETVPVQEVVDPFVAYAVNNPRLPIKTMAFLEDHLFNTAPTEPDEGKMPPDTMDVTVPYLNETRTVRCTGTKVSDGRLLFTCEDEGFIYFADAQTGHLVNMVPSGRLPDIDAPLSEDALRGIADGIFASLAETYGFADGLMMTDVSDAAGYYTFVYSRMVNDLESPESITVEVNPDGTFCGFCVRLPNAFLGLTLPADYKDRCTAAAAQCITEGIVDVTNTGILTGVCTVTDISCEEWEIDRASDGRAVVRFRADIKVLLYNGMTGSLSHVFFAVPVTELKG